MLSESIRNYLSKAGAGKDRGRFLVFATGQYYASPEKDRGRFLVFGQVKLM